MRPDDQSHRSKEQDRAHKGLESNVQMSGVRESEYSQIGKEHSILVVLGPKITHTQVTRKGLSGERDVVPLIRQNDVHGVPLNEEAVGQGGKGKTQHSGDTHGYFSG